MVIVRCGAVDRAAGVSLWRSLTSAGAKTRVFNGHTRGATSAECGLGEAMWLNSY